MLNIPKIGKLVLTCINWKEIKSIGSGNPPCKDGDARFSTVP